ncbi:DUF418 domain-containing protein [Nocardiopsis lambiniae]|uniref:DUF418 domain-containing protein n=1 Tax=Nocardiopsis lambiniae TaxID=3075539 RepID=A0ABU2M3A2_9ACTN|nr:DUF418 domain-containing protein [Nocardiopsis sp. DSM 44743]MDT0327107.1 DUF418 domain-containing protein [Nocardiopsis sp. DSM 44743]
MTETIGVVRSPTAEGTRVAFLDIARALAMIGVVMMNVTVVVFSAESAGGRPMDTLTSVVNGALSLLMSGKARAMLMVLLGIGAVLAWRAAERRGDRPMVVMLRRYAVLGLLFGVPHLLVFSGDILTHYSVTALVLAPLMPLLLAGGRTRPLIAALLAFAIAPFVEHVVPLSGEWAVLLLLVPQTLGFFCVGVWLARRPELDPATAEDPSRLPAGMVWTGLAGQILGIAVMFGSDLLFPMEFDADGVPVLGPEGMPVVDPAAGLLTSVAGTLMGLGGALFYLGLVWWSVRRRGAVARALGVLAPLGRMTLTVYLGGTAVFLLVMDPWETRIPMLAQYALAAGYFAVMLVFAHLWSARFRYGPLEWLWRLLTHLRPLPMRRRPRTSRAY